MFFCSFRDEKCFIQSELDMASLLLTLSEFFNSSKSFQYKGGEINETIC